MPIKFFALFFVSCEIPRFLVCSVTLFCFRKQMRCIPFSGWKFVLACGLLDVVFAFEYTIGAGRSFCTVYRWTEPTSPQPLGAAERRLFFFVLLLQEVKNVGLFVLRASCCGILRNCSSWQQIPIVAGKTALYMYSHTRHTRNWNWNRIDFFCTPPQRSDFHGLRRQKCARSTIIHRNLNLHIMENLCCFVVGSNHGK